MDNSVHEQSQNNKYKRLQREVMRNISLLTVNPQFCPCRRGEGGVFGSLILCSEVIPSSAMFPTDRGKRSACPSSPTVFFPLFLFSSPLSFFLLFFFFFWLLFSLLSNGCLVCHLLSTFATHAPHLWLSRSPIHHNPPYIPPTTTQEPCAAASYGAQVLHPAASGFLFHWKLL